LLVSQGFSSTGTGIEERRKHLVTTDFVSKFTIAYTDDVSDKRKPDTLLAAIRRLDRGQSYGYRARVCRERQRSLVAVSGAVWIAIIFHDRGLLMKKDAEEISGAACQLLYLFNGALKGNLTANSPTTLPRKDQFDIDQRTSRCRNRIIVRDQCRCSNLSWSAEVAAHGKHDQWKKTGDLQQKFNEMALQKLLWPAILDAFMSQNAPILKF
jgi:hypothetical protein